MPNELAKIELPTYRLEPGDRILIESVNLDSEIGSLGDQQIQIDGSVDLGKFGRIRVSGMSVENVEQVIENQISFYGKPEPINVQLVESNAAEVYVLGEVGSPAAYRIDGHEHVLDAILLAGGLTSKASPCDIVLARPTSPEGCRVVLPVCYRQITQLGDVTTNYQLQPGDRIVVGSRSFREELAFWRQGKACPRCSRSCGVECQPGSVQYQNRFPYQQPPFPPPARQSPAQVDKIGVVAPEQNGHSKNNGYDSRPGAIRENFKSDADLFLPKLQPTNSNYESGRN
jgi:polysaccharide export outer membrane protein